MAEGLGLAKRRKPAVINRRYRPQDVPQKTMFKQTAGSVGKRFTLGDPAYRQGVNEDIGPWNGYINSIEK